MVFVAMRYIQVDSLDLPEFSESPVDFVKHLLAQVFRVARPYGLCDVLKYLRVIDIIDF